MFLHVYLNKRVLCDTVNPMHPIPPGLYLMFTASLLAAVSVLVQHKSLESK